ncbi:MAG: 5-formyltetrahydrofolate cyclo-ligase, partial [Pseudorhodobacter sp.]|nr:5-formyltetrahydrofolate cyclo-ligase [Pseudorhodobacter sp.]
MVDDVKAAMRKAAYAARRPAFEVGPGRAADFLADYLAAFKGSALAGYMPMRTEIDPLPAMAAHQGPVGVPVIIAKATPLQFCAWTPDAVMVAGEFGARVPEAGDW